MFENEDIFQAFFIRNFGGSYLGDWLFAKITKIAVEFIQPEIDLLDIFPISPERTVSAYEFKVLNSNKMGNNYSRIYSGIGQAMSYFNYGVDRSYLVIGISNNISPESSASVRGNIRLIGEFVSRLHVDRFQIIMYDEFLNDVWDIPPISPSGRFHGSSTRTGHNQPLELARENILAGNFTKRKGNNFFRRHNLDQYVS